MLPIFTSEYNSKQLSISNPNPFLLRWFRRPIFSFPLLISGLMLFLDALLRITIYPVQNITILNLEALEYLI